MVQDRCRVHHPYTPLLGGANGPRLQFHIGGQAADNSVHIPGATLHFSSPPDLPIPAPIQVVALRGGEHFPVVLGGPVHDQLCAAQPLDDAPRLNLRCKLEPSPAAQFLKQLRMRHRPVDRIEVQHLNDNLQGITIAGLKVKPVQVALVRV
jgi:hypothetical protein